MEESGQDVPYYRIEVAIKLVREGNWSDYPNKQPVQMRGVSLTMPRDQLNLGAWKQALGELCVGAALSAAVAEIKKNGQAPQVVVPQQQVVV